MKITHSTQSFIATYFTLADRIILSLFVLTLLTSTTLLHMNQWFFHFSYLSAFSGKFSLRTDLKILLVIGLTLCMVFYGIYAKKTMNREATFLWAFGIIVCACFASITLAAAIQTTPFPPIDKYLAHFDTLIGINTPSLMAWVHQHPKIHHLLRFTYATLEIQLFVIPVGLACFNARRSITVFFIAQFLIYLIGCLIYYFFPTAAPSSAFNSPYFSIDQHLTALRFYDVHHFIPPPSAAGGLIAFPSFHVIWAVLLTYATKQKKWIFYPLCFFNSILIISTVLLGWHYATDVIAGILLAILGIYVGERCVRETTEPRA